MTPFIDPPTIPSTSSATQQLAALLLDAGFFEQPARALLTCTGEDRVRWLNGMVTNHVGALEKNHGCYAFVLNAQGRIQGDVNIYQRGHALWLDTDASQVEALTTFLDRFIIMDDVTLAAAPHLARLGVAGRQAAAVLQKIGLNVEGLQPLQLREQLWNKSSVTVVAAHSPLVPRYELWLDMVSVPSLQQALLAANATDCAANAVEQLRILEGTPAYGQDITARDLPQETSQLRALHFSKGCYLGQEIVERIRSRGNVHRTFSGFLLAALPPASEETPEKISIIAQGQPVGDLTSAANIVLPDGSSQCFALGTIRREVLDKKIALESQGISLVATPLPFRWQQASGSQV